MDGSQWAIVYRPLEFQIIIKENDVQGVGVSAMHIYAIALKNCNYRRVFAGFLDWIKFGKVLCDIFSVSYLCAMWYPANHVTNGF